MHNTLLMLAASLILVEYAPPEHPWPQGFSLAVATFRTGDTEIFVVDPGTRRCSQPNPQPRHRASVILLGRRTARGSPSIPTATVRIISTLLMPMVQISAS